MSLFDKLLHALHPYRPRPSITLPTIQEPTMSSDILAIVAEVEAIVVQVKAAAADGKVSLKEVIALAGALTKLIGHIAGLV